MVGSHNVGAGNQLLGSLGKQPAFLTAEPPTLCSALLYCINLMTKDTEHFM